MVKVNNSWIDEEEIETENIEVRKMRIIDGKISEVIDLIVERDELYEVRLVYELQGETRRIEQLKKELELIALLEKDSNEMFDLDDLIGWIEETQEKYKL